MSLLWRISNHRTLNGIGGLLAPGRWHNQGRPIVYCAANPGTALLEILVRLEVDPEDLPPSLVYLEIQAPDDVAAEHVGDLPDDWQERTDITRQIGDAWLRSLRSALLYVPSVIVPATENTLINPTHPDAGRLTIAAIHDKPLDARLLRR